MPCETKSGAVFQPAQDSQSRLVRGPQARATWLYALISLLVAVPCFWSARLHTLDLASHVYNAWLAGIASNEPALGIYVVPVWTNMLFDLLVSALLSVSKFYIAERIAACVAALVFFWSCFFLTSRIHGHAVWRSTPVFAALAYGFVFRLGFFNFYLATALSIAALALLWHPTRARLFLSIPLFGLAAVAHVLPVVWSIAICSYICIFRRVSGVFRMLLTFASAAGIVLIAMGVSRWLPVDRAPGRFSLIALLDVTGAGQLATYDQKFLLLSGGWLMAVVGAALLRFPFRRGPWMHSPLLYLWMLHVLAFAVVPDAIQFPQHSTPLSFLPERIAFFAAVLVSVSLFHFVKGGIVPVFGALALLFFVFTYNADAGADEVSVRFEQSVQSLPERTAVVASFQSTDTRVPLFAHLLDRACTGHCYNFGNYEPASRAFRVRVTPGSIVATAASDDVFGVEAGDFVRRASDPPLYTICHCTDDPNRLCPRSLEIGDRVCSIDTSRLAAE